MARGVTLTTLVTNLRAEIGQNTSSTVGQQELDGLKQLIRRTQERLYEQYDWSFLNAVRDITLGAGQRFYDFPDDMTVEGVAKVQAKWNGQRLPVEYGIDDEQYNSLDPDQAAASGYFDITAGTAPTAATGAFTVNGGTAGASNKITNITVNGISIISSAVLWATSHTATAAAVAAAINSFSSSPEYTATAALGVVTISASPNQGATPNGFVVDVTVGGDVTVTSVTNMAGGVSNLISSVTVDGLEILGGSVGWATSNSATATAVAAAINAETSYPNYTAVASGNRVTISALESEGADANDRAIVVTVAGTVTAGTPVDLADGETGGRSDPVQRWQVMDDGDGEQIEVWPLPSTSGGILRLSGKRTLSALAADSDTCDLDGTLIVLVAAAEKRAGQKDGEAKAAAAQSHLVSLRGNAKKSGSFRFGEKSTGGRARFGTVIRVAGAA